MKKFKLTMITVIILTFGFIVKSNAQNQPSGLYLTFNDYLQHKLSYAGNLNGNKIHVHEFFGENKVTVTSNDKTEVFAKSETFGYRDRNNCDYRFFNKNAYQIVDTTGFYIYSRNILAQQGKGYKPTKVYYFSKKASDEIMPLTPENLASVFPNNYNFRLMAELEYKSGLDLGAYDSVSNAYKIKELYAASIK